MPKRKGLLTVADKTRLAKSARQFLRDNPGEEWDTESIREAYALTLVEARELLTFMGIKADVSQQQEKTE